MKIYTLFFLFLFLLFEKNLGQIRSNIIIKNDFAFIYVNLSVTSGEFSITSRSLSYNGWSLFAFSTSNSSLNDSLIFLSYINNGNFQIERLIGRNQTLFLQETDVNDTLVLRKRRFISINNQIPTGELNEIFYSLVFNESLFRKTLPFNNNTLYLHLYSDTKDKPVIPMDEVFLNNRIVVTINLQQRYFQNVYGISRWSSLHLAPFILELLFYILVFILLIIFSQKQPLKSRSLTPFISNISQFLTLLGSLPFFFTLELRSYSFCYFNIFLIYSQQISFLLLFIHLFRYILIINLNYKKGIYISTKGQNEDETKMDKLEFPFLILKLLSHPLLNLIVSSLYFIIFVSLEVIIYFSLGNQCNDRSDTAIAILYSTFTLILIALTLILIIYDVISNIKTVISVGICQFFFKKDPLFFRIEVYFIGSLLFLYFIIVTIIAFTLSNRIYIIISYSLGIHLLFIYQVLFILSITVIKSIRGLFIKEIKPDVIDEILNDEEGHKLFSSFADSEFSIENVSCWDDIRLYKKEKDPVKKQSIATSIYYTYLNGMNSKLEVNCNSQICVEINNQIQNLKPNELKEDLFEKLDAALKINLCDTYSRIIYNDDFKVFLQKQKFHKDSLNGK